MKRIFKISIVMGLTAVILMSYYINAESWEIVTIGSWDGYTELSEIVIDSNNVPHISYSDGTDDFLKHAKLGDNGWEIDVIDNSMKQNWGDLYRYIDMAIDSNDNPHVGYKFDNELRYATWTGNSWQIETIDIEAGFGENIYGVSIDIDTNDKPHISFWNNMKLYYATSQASNWTIEELFNNVGAMNGFVNPDIAIDSNYNIHIITQAYDFSDDWHIRYFVFNGANWSSEFVYDTSDELGGLGVKTTMGLDNQNMPHISFFDSQNEALMYGYKESNNWMFETIDSLNNWNDYLIGPEPSIILDVNNTPHVCYLQILWDNPTLEIDLNYSFKGNNGWESISIVINSDIESPSMVMDGSGNFHMSYIDYENQQIKHAKGLQSNDDGTDGNGTPGFGFELIVIATVIGLFFFKKRK